MDRFQEEDLQALREPAEGPCVSLFLPTHRVGGGSGEDRIRLRNLARDAQRRLEKAGMGAKAARTLLGPLRPFLQGERLWRRMGDGLAMFVRPEWFRWYRLPISFREIVSVGERFTVKPLLPLAASPERLFVLALSQNEVRLLEGTPVRPRRG